MQRVFEFDQHTPDEVMRKQYDDSEDAVDSGTDSDVSIQVESTEPDLPS